MGLMDYAVIEVGGKQYKICKGDTLSLDNFKGEKEGTIVFDKVMLLVRDSKAKIGNPFLSNVSAKGKVLGVTRSSKVKGMKFLAKSRYRKVYGERHNVVKVALDF